jgi:hypothetical protein
MVDNWALRSTVDRAYRTPPTFLPLTGGGGVRVGGIFHVGPSYVSPSCQLEPPSLITTYLLTPPLSKPPNHSYIPPLCSDVTLHYPLHITLHYHALPPHSTTLPTCLTHVNRPPQQGQPTIAWSHEFISQGHIKGGASMSLSSTLEFGRSRSAF